ncbi:hypothetical protein GNI_006970 [Gregarina niphandrodes]|uniref:Developmentally regulated GTP-binding protein n=1 Tax=Gregarina niphandrodes TaxID=110365 RepID=A0A023BD71_GRENI|nr:hypothetical protein GNI_006970 [Gregarina niphandrodes]EZG87459.1 hypothetical protein GNI_006970 [Gregarina niphandrodes]|eukprot:XP_011128664.1 hypothetical protein GNI_006970 [Gregarina niphandrodes]
MTTLAKIAEIEAEIARTQKNKATNFHIGLLKAKLAKLRQQLVSISPPNPPPEFTLHSLRT